MPFFGVPIRNGLPIGLGSSAGFGIQPFDPSYLFAAGEQGAWYDPSDYSTLFQDSAGTTPVTAVEQSVGLMLDKSKGLVLGPELVTNGTFHTDVSGWSTSSANVTISWDSGRLKAVNGGTVSSTFVYQQLTTVVGRWYKAVLPVTNGTFRAFVSTDATLATTVVVVDNEQTFYFLATTTTSTLGFRPLLNNSTLFADNISVKEITGNHAYQSTSTSRPVLRARYNLLTYSEQFNNAAWIKNVASIADNTATAPNNTQTAATITLNTSTISQIAYQSIAGLAANTNYTMSLYVKSGVHKYFALILGNDISTAWVTVCFDLDTKIVSKTQAGADGTYVSASLTLVPGTTDWYLATVTGRLTSVPKYFQLQGISSGTPTLFAYGVQVNWAAPSGSTFYVWGADFRPANQVNSLIPAYQRIAAATVYDTSGFLPYLAFDGVDDSMLTNSVNFTATDKMTVWAGVRKLSDVTSYAMLAELSAAYSTNNGAFSIMAPYTSGQYGFGLRGTSNALDGYVSGYSAPVTNVLATKFDTAGASNSLKISSRINSQQQTLTYAVSTSGGNYGNYPLYIGRRNNATLPFNGWLTSLIIRGAASTDAQISDTETWVNGKTGAY